MIQLIEAQLEEWATNYQVRQRIHFIQPFQPSTRDRTDILKPVTAHLAQPLEWRSNKVTLGYSVCFVDDRWFGTLDVELSNHFIT